MTAVTDGSAMVTRGTASRMGTIARWAGNLASLDTRYYAVDGGAGAAVLVELAGADARVRPTDAPRHADVLVVVEPVAAKLMPAIIETYRDMDAPPLVAIAPPEDMDRRGDSARLEEHLPVAQRMIVAASPQPRSLCPLVAAIRDAARGAARTGASDNGFSDTVPEEVVIAPDEREREIATEDVVVSIGPVQAVTAGPCRFLLTMDGEQVTRAESEAGYASRGLERTLAGTGWNDALLLASRIDPLAPLAGRLLLVQLLERLQGMSIPDELLALRGAALRIERAYNHLVWLTRFATLLGHDALADDARSISAAVAAQLIAASAIIPGNYAAQPSESHSPDALDRAGARVTRCVASLEASRLIALRTRGLGVISAADAERAGATGPVLSASRDGAGDARARMLARARAAANDLREASAMLRNSRARTVHGAAVGAGATAAKASSGQVESVAVEGPRGAIEMTAEITGDTIVRAAWTRPSLKHLSLVPAAIVGLTLPDALVVIASFDLAMAEADA